MIKALVLVAATLSEHWVCAAPVDPSTNPAYIFLFDFTVEGNEIVQHSQRADVTLRHRILLNDDRRIIFESQPPPALGVIEKRAVLDPSFKIYPQGGEINADGRVEGLLAPQGTCEMFQ
jgi:hypothetical protein